MVQKSGYSRGHCTGKKKKKERNKEVKDERKRRNNEKRKRRKNKRTQSPFPQATIDFLPEFMNQILNTSITTIPSANQKPCSALPPFSPLPLLTSYDPITLNTYLGNQSFVASKSPTINRAGMILGTSAKVLTRKWIKPQTAPTLTLKTTS